MNKQFEYISDGVFSPSKHYMNLLCISGLKPNTFYDLTFSDLILSYYSNNQGVIYFNNEKQALPITCIPYSDIRIHAWRNKDKITTPPIGSYSNTPQYNKIPCDPIYMDVDLTEFDPNTQQNKQVKRKILIKNGTLTLLPQQSMSAYPKYHYEDHIGVL